MLLEANYLIQSQSTELKIKRYLRENALVSLIAPGVSQAQFSPVEVAQGIFLVSPM